MTNCAVTSAHRHGVMATLGVEQRFSLSCGQGAVRNEQMCMVHVKLTDSALRTLAGFQMQTGKKPGSQQPVICFEGSRGYIRIPSRHAENGERCFSFDVSSVGDEHPQGSLEIIQQPLDSTRGCRLLWLGNVVQKVTVCATDETYRATHERMTQAEEVARSRSAIVIKPGGPFIGKRVTRKPLAATLDTAPERKPSVPRNPSAPARRSGPLPQCQNPVRVQSETNECSRRQVRARVIHLLALAPYQKAELLLRLMSEGLEPGQKEQLGPVLAQVGAPLRDGVYTLQDALYSELQRDWPGYSAEERHNLNSILTRKLENVPQDGEHKGSPRTCSPADRDSPTLKRPHNDGAVPLASKKQRIAHSRTHPSAPTSQAACKRSAAPEKPPATDPKETHLPVSEGEVELACKVLGKKPDTDTEKEEGKSKSDLQILSQGKQTEIPPAPSGKQREVPPAPSGKQREVPPAPSGKQREVPPAPSGKQREVPPAPSGKQREVPPAPSGKQREVPPAPSGKQREVPPAPSGKQREVPPAPSGKQREVPPAPSGKQREVPPAPSGKQREVPPAPSGKQREVPPAPSGKQREVPPAPSGKQRDVPPAPSGKQRDVPPAPSGKQREVPRAPSGKQSETPLLKCEPLGPEHEHDFLSEYPPLKTADRRTRYKEDFNEEYAEYRTLHSRIQEVTQHFAQLETQLLALDPNSEQYKIIREKVFHEFEALKQKHPRYQEEKHHCQYLHLKLAHIKQCIKNYDMSCSATDR
uniref:RNA polymerase II elongation factor ELL-like isoform X1 n=2 Tax=Myxine glutinosa TaxID=7769 RepID=UPI00358F1008